MAPQQKSPTVEEEIPPNIRAGMIFASPPKGEEVVISGIAGFFPESESVYHFRDNLLGKVDMVTDENRRWNLDHPEIPTRHGKVHHVSKFDAAFFGIHYKQAQAMDPMCRLILERAYEAVLDAGINPYTLRGSRVGVFVGACFSESEKTWFYEKLQINGYAITGCSRVMLANRISYWLGVNGPSYAVDSACSSSLYALEHAYKSIRGGHCDSAIVGGCNLCLHPFVTLQFSRLGVLSADGICRSFDNKASGYARSEAIAVVYLQKAKDSKRIYATLLHAKTNCDGYKEEGITYPSGLMQQKLLEDFYAECRVDPTTLGYIEAHGTGTKVGDPEELNAIDKVFCKGRQTPLPIGSVKSNIGHSEPASGLCSITKVVIAFEEGFIPPNLHYDTPREGVEALETGRLQVVTDVQKLDYGLIGVNSFGFGGANCHTLLRWNEKVKVNGSRPNDNLPRLVVASGRTEEAVLTILQDVESRPVDVEYVRLLHDIHASDIPGHMYRGFVLAGTGKIKSQMDVKQFGDVRPLWLVFSGLHSQWPRISKSLLDLPAFSATIAQLKKVLKPKGIDITSILEEGDEKMFDNCLLSVVATTAIQMALVDVLKKLKVSPQGMVGYSTGEIACAYAGGLITAEQAILTAYACGLAHTENVRTKGATAQVELGHQDLAEFLLPDVEVVVHSSLQRSVLCGPTDTIATCIAALRKSGVTVSGVKPSNNMFHHSQFFTRGTKKLLSLLKEVIPQPQARCQQIVGCSPPSEKLAGAEYFAHALSAPVLLQEAAGSIPRNAVIVEVAPHGFLQDALELALHKSVVNFALLDRNMSDTLETLLASIGRLYQYGAQPQLADIYPAVKYPVSRGTPMISPLVKWDHSQDWFVTSYELQEKAETGERTVPINISEENLEFHSGHVIDGRNLFAATGYLVLVWETLALMSGQFIKDVPIVFENIRFIRATNIPKEGTIEFVISIQKCSGNFEIVESGVAIVTGRCYIPKSPSEEMDNLDVPEPVDPSLIDLSRRDIYKELRLRGYNYSGLFRGIISADNLGKSGKVQWKNNWVAFMDNMLQIQILQEDTRGLFVPTSIDKLTVDPKKHLQEIQTDGEIEYFPVYVYKEVGVIHSGGIELKGLKASGISRRKPLGEPVLEKYLFVPHYKNLEPPLPINDVLRMCVHIMLENQAGIKVKTVEVAEFEDGKELHLFSNELAAILEDLPLIQADITVVTPPGKGEIPDLSPNVHVEDRNLTGQQNCLLIIASNVIGQKALLETAVGALSPKGFLIAREKLDSTPVLLDPTLKIVLDLNADGERIILLKKVAPVSNFVVIHVENDVFSWLPEVQKAIKEVNNERIVLVSERDSLSGLIGFVNCIRKEPGGETVSGVLILDPEAPPFSLTDSLYSEELEKDLAMIVYKDAEWGSYRHLKMSSLPLITCPHAYVNVATRGDLSSLQWFQGHLDEYGNPKRPDEKLVHIYYSALNFRDIMTATGKIAAEVVSVGRLNQECVQGLEFSGKDENGRRYMGMVASNAMATMVYADPSLLWEIPDSWTLEEAATVPVVYGTAYFALFLNGRMQKGESVLIHAGSGGVGQAAITLALGHGCLVFTTVGTPEKRAFIKERFPQLTDLQIGNSRDTSFEQLIMEETEGRGVDLVLNSLAEEKLQASVRCLAQGGRFLEIGKFDLSSNNPLGLEVFLKGASFHGITLEKMFYEVHEWKSMLNTLMTEGIASGSIKPLTRTTFQADEIEPAFRFMAAGKHIGKVLVKVRQEEALNTEPKPIFVQATPKYFCNCEKSYIVAGGLGGFGLELVDWLIIRGARRILLTSRTGVRTGYQCTRVRVWRSYGVTLRISTADITTEEGAESVIQEAAELGPVDAIFNLAVVLHDAIFENQTEEMFAKSAAPKSVATGHLDRVSRRLCPQLEHFVVFSSVSCGRGNAGQTNYGMFNSVMERICEARVKDGLPGLAVQWGAIGEVGLVAEMQEEQHELVIGGTLQQKISSCLAVLDQFLLQPNPVVASMVVAEKRAGGYGAGGIVDCVANIMGIRDLKTVSLHSTLAELGMDSMMAVEIKQSLERDFEVFLTPQDVRSMTFARLAEIASTAVEGDALSAEQDEVKLIGDIDFLDVTLMISVIGDEATGRLPVVELPSAVDPADKTGPLVFMLPGIEGMAQVLTPLAVNLLYRTFSLQLRNDDYSDTVSMLVDELYPVLKESLPADKPFIIIGYSFGGILALDVVHKLEEEGHRGKFVMIDSSPDYLQELCNVQVQMGNEDSMQVNLLMAIVSVLAPQSSSSLQQIKSYMEKVPTWKERLEYLLTLGDQKNFVHSTEYVFSVATSLYARVRALKDYEYGNTNRKIQSETILIKSKTTTRVTDDDYGLPKICKDLKIYEVDGSHVTMLEMMECADIINNFIAGENNL